MKIILANDVLGVGDLGQIVTVKGGFARNFLIPQGLAFDIESKGKKQIEHIKYTVESKRKQLQIKAEKVADQLRDLVVKTELKVGTAGKVYGSVTSKEISEKLAAEGHEIDKRRIHLDGPIKVIGTHFVDVKLHSEVSVKLKVEVSEVAASEEDESKAAEVLKENLEDAAQEFASTEE